MAIATTPTIDKPAEKVIEKPILNDAPETKVGTRAVLWSPAKDPTTFGLPRGASEMRPFVMAYLDEAAIPPYRKGV